MKKKLLVILGAGSSIPVGMPSVGALDEYMKRWGEEWAAEYGFPDYFDALWHSVRAYYESGHPSLRPALNFEKVLGEMVALAHWMTPAPWGDSLRQVASNGGAAPGIQFAYQTEKYGPTITVMDQLSRLLGKLAQHMRLLCVKVDYTGAEILRYQTVINTLRDAFELGIYNLNYDTAALTAWPEAYAGFGDTGVFEPNIVHDQKEKWNFIYHLHGSVHHSLVRQLGSEICWRRDLSDTHGFFDTQEGQSSDKRSEGRSFPITTLIAGGFKLDQMLIEPFHSLHAALVRHLYEADAILIGGYGFGDVHINRALRNRLTAPGERPPIIVLDYASNQTDPMAFRADLWAHELSATLRTGGSFFFEPGHSSPPVPLDLAAARSFEVAALHRVALWYGGFTEASTGLDRIIPWLDGGSDEVLRP
jgi:hypothetical protein